MKALDVVGMAWTAIAGHRLRTGLSLLGVAIGVCAVVVLTSLGEGARNYVRGEFESLGTNLLIVIPGKSETSGAIPGFGGAPNDLTLDDAEAIRRGVRGAEVVVPVVVGSETVSNGERRRQVPVVGATTAFLDARKLAIRQGQFLPELEWDRSSPVVVLGQSLAGELFPGESAIGGRVRIGDARARVIGVLAPKGTQLGLDMDDLAIVPVGTGMRLFNRSSLFRIVVQVVEGGSIERAQEQVIALITERHGEEDITCITQDSVSGALTAILAVLTLAVAGIAAISLSVAGIGIMNVMLVSVSERTKEIGLVRALGARRRQVVALFLVEAVLLTGAGGTVGLAASWAVTRVAGALFPDFPIDAPPWAIAAALGLSVVVGTVFGVVPARNASRLDPVAALGGGK